MTKYDFKILLHSSFSKAAFLLIVVYFSILFVYLFTDFYNSSINFWGITFTYVFFWFFHGRFLYKSYHKLLFIRNLGINLEDYEQSPDFWFEFRANDKNPFRISLSPTDETVLFEFQYTFADDKDPLNVIYKVKNDMSFETSDNDIDSILNHDFSNFRQILDEDFEQLVDMNFAFE